MHVAAPTAHAHNIIMANLRVIAAVLKVSCKAGEVTDFGNEAGEVTDIGSKAGEVTEFGVKK